MADQNRTPEETLAVLTARSKDEDTFKIKLIRRKGMQSEQICTLADASIQHIANPETWIPRLAGGGSYFLHVYHRNEPMPLGVPIPYSAQGAPIDVDPRVVTDSKWAGPATMIFPELPDANKQQAPIPTVTALGANPPASYTPPNTVPGQGINHLAPSTSPGIDPAVFNQLQNQIAMLAQQIAMSNKDRQFELEMMKQQYENQLKLAEKERAIMAANTKPTQDFASTLAPLITAMAPIITVILESGKHSREASTRAAEESAKQTQNLIASLMAKPSVDPVFQQTVQTMLSEIKAAKQDNSPAAQTVATMSEAMSGMTKTAIQLFHAAAEIGNGGQPKEPPGLMVAKEVSKALVALGNGMAKAHQMNGPPPPQQQQRQLPPQGQRRPVQQHQPKPKPGLVDHLEKMIRAKKPAEEVSEVLFSNLDNEQLQTELAAHGGDVNNLIAARLGDWLAVDESNRTYLATIFNTMEHEGVQKGVIAPAVTAPAAEIDEVEEEEEDFEDGADGDDPESGDDDLEGEGSDPGDETEEGSE